MIPIFLISIFTLTLKKIKIKILLSFLCVICISSCTKQPSTISSPVTQARTSGYAITGKGGTLKWSISIEFNHQWRSFWHTCYPSTWYCWQFGTGTSDNKKSYIEIDEENQLITFGIDNRDSSVYNSQFMVGTDFQFPQDTLNYNLNAASGLNDNIYVNAGLYHFDIVDSTIVVKVPFNIIP